MIARKTLLALGNFGVGVVLGLVALKLTARYFGVEAFGEVEFALSLLGILYLFTDLNMSEAHVKRVSEGVHPGDCLATFAVFKAVSTAIFVSLSLLSVYVYAVVLGKPLVSVTFPVILLMVGYYVAKSAATVAQSTFEARTETARGQAGSFAETIVRVVLTAVFAFALAAFASGVGPLVGRLDSDNAMWQWVQANPAAALALTWTAGALINAAISVGLVLRSLDHGRFRWSVLRSYFLFSLPLFLVSAVGIVSGYIDRVALGFFGSDADVGDFSGLRRIVMVIDGIGAAVGLLLFPALSALVARGDFGEAQRTLTRSSRYLSLIIVPAAAFLAAFPAPIIQLILADEWLGSAWTLSVLAIWVVVITISRPHIYVLMAIDKPSVPARIGLFTAFLNIVLNIILIPDDIQMLGLQLFGLKALGAALATLISSLVYYMLVVLAAKRFTGYAAPVLFWRHIVASLVMVGALALANAYGPLELNRWFSIPPYVLVGGAVYFAALFALRELTRDDYAYVRELLNPAEMWRYIRSELRGR